METGLILNTTICMAVTGEIMAEIKFKRVDVTVFSFDPPKILLKWVLEPTILPLQDYEFRIERSENISDGFKHLYTASGTAPDYIDYTAEFHNVQRKYYYKVTATNTKSGAIIVAPIGTWEGEPNLVAMEMIRRLDFLLDDRTGHPTFVFGQMSEGPRCSECWDRATSRSTNPDCPVCKGTGRYGGYYNAVLVMIDFYPDAKVTAHTGWGETQEAQMDILLSSYPTLKNRDILIKADNNKTYIVDNVRPIEEPGSDTIIHQVARVAEMNRSDIETKLNIPEDIRTEAANNLRERKEKREF